MGIIKKYSTGNKIDKLQKIEKALKEIVEFKHNYKWKYEITSYSVELNIDTREIDFKDDYYKTQYFQDCLKIIEHLNKNKIKFSLYNWNDRLSYSVRLP